MDWFNLTLEDIRDIWGRRWGALPSAIFSPMVETPAEGSPNHAYPDSGDDERIDASTPTVKLPAETYRYLIWNAGPGNNDDNVRTRLEDYMKDTGTDWALLSEITKHTDALRRIRGYKVMGAPDSVALLYSDKLVAENPYMKHMTRKWRGPRTGRPHPPRTFPRLTLSHPGTQPVRVGPLHLTAYCKWRSGVLVSRVPGAASAFREQAEWLRRNSLNFPNRREFFGGDLNALWSSRGKFSLNWIENEGKFTGHATVGRVDSVFFKHGSASIRSLGEKWGSDTHKVYVGTFRPKPM